MELFHQTKTVEIIGSSSALPHGKISECHTSGRVYHVEILKKRTRSRQLFEEEKKGSLSKLRFFDPAKKVRIKAQS